MSKLSRLGACVGAALVERLELLIIGTRRGLGRGRLTGATNLIGRICWLSLFLACSTEGYAQRSEAAVKPGWGTACVQRLERQTVQPCQTHQTSAVVFSQIRPTTSETIRSHGKWKRILVSAGVGSAASIVGRAISRDGDGRLLTPVTYTIGTVAGLLMVEPSGRRSAIVAGATLGAIPLIAAGALEGPGGDRRYRDALRVLGFMAVPVAAVAAQNATSNTR